MLTHEQWLQLHNDAHNLDSESLAVLSETAKALRVIGPNSRALVRDIVRRLVVGMPLGDWNRRLDLVANAIEENVDEIDYLTVEVIRQRDRLGALERAREAALRTNDALRMIPPEQPPAEPMHAGGE